MCQTSCKLLGLECRHVLMCTIKKAMGWWIISLVNTQGKCYSGWNTGSSEEKNYYHIRCSVTHCCLWFFVFCFFFGYTIKDNRIQFKLFQNCTEKKWMNHNIPIPKLIIRTTMKRCGCTQSVPGYVVFSASKKMVQI